MRKNLFLTLAFAFAALAGVNAQDWSRTLTTDDNLPGEKTTIDDQERYVYNSGKITPSEPLQSLRLTFGETEGNNSLNNYPFVNLAELLVIGAEGDTISYTATSNADHNTMSGAENPDGDGLKALNDGKYTNYWHSCWEGSVAEYHYLELTFDKPVSEFTLEWATRGGNYFHNAPTMVGLTPGGVEFVPFADWNFSVGNQITTMEALKAVPYFAMKSTVPVEYDEYKNNNDGADGYNFGDKINKEPKKGPGPQFVNAGSVAEAPDASYAIQLVPAGDNGYYLYFVKDGKFLSKHQSHNSYNGANGLQGKTGVISNAAVVNIKELPTGRFEMSYTMQYEGQDVLIYMGATPSTGGFKNVDAVRKAFYDAGNLYCLNYAYVIKFDWELYEINMDFPTRYFSKPVKTAITEAEGIHTYMDSVAVEGYEDSYNTFLAALDVAKDGIENNKYQTVESLFADVNALNNAMGAYVYSKIEWYKAFLKDFANEYKNKLVSQNNPQDGYYIREVYNIYIQQNVIDVCNKLYNGAYEDPYSYIDEMKEFINSVDGNIETFLASKVEFVTLPKVYSTDDPEGKALGNEVRYEGKDKNGNPANYVRNDWEQLVVLQEGVKVDGIRLTFLGTRIGGSGGGGKFKGYPMVALSGLEVLDQAGNKVAITSSLVTTNSLETSEGAIENLFDDDVNTYYHSIWANGNMSPEGYVYLDVQFPEGVELNTFTVRTIGRGQGQVSLAPSSVCITEDGVVYDPLLFRPNEYNVAGGTQITDVAQLRDGGIYIISGNLRAKTMDAAPRFYSGEVPYHTNIAAALNDPCVYMFKKTEKGWNIVSLANAQYWALNKEVNEVTNEETKEVTKETSYSTGLTIYPENAGEIQIVKSGNLENTFVFYSELEDNMVSASWSWKNPNDSTDIVKIEEGTVNANKFVYMDWDGGIAARPCVSELPGVFEYGLEAIDAHAKAQDFKDGDGYTAGDYLHFNKANGEGEWNIYEVTMDSPYYLWANSITEKLPVLGLSVGKDPGSLTGDIAALESAVKDVEAVVAANNKGGAQAAVEAFDANVALALTAERVKVQNGYWYAIESAYPEYYATQGAKKAIYATAANLAWKNAPAKYNRDNAEFVFRFDKYDGVADPDGYNVPEEYVDCVFRIYNNKHDVYVGEGSRGGVVATSEDEFFSSLYVVRPLEANCYTIHAIGADPLHTNGHINGEGIEGTIVYWEGGVNSTSSWYIRYVDEPNGTSIEDLVVEGAEVVSVAYFTPAGAAVPAPVSGINIVVTVYSNGVVETKKVLVK